MERLPKRVMLGEMVGGEGHSGEGRRGTSRSFGIKLEGWREAAQKAGTDGSDG